ncbi:protein CUSTOS isoform X1 [Antechinus flavipes]|uniref:protein CUSTOS isoform X1 n=1 Tax=Antechinus flavipes TaxID=38775 RepID=UPI002235FEBF|nr:protein CUSTOS isoform X1 [Antechinus flavipes]
MAAPRGSVSDSESSEDSDAEELQRCREAALPAWGLGPRPERGQELPAPDPLPAARPSLRQKADEHEQDGNELQTTPEFRLHVAKKLGAFLDSCITISESSPRPVQAPVQTDAGEDDGFRLFFTSVPGSPKKEAGPPAVRRKRPPSSSSSESDSGDEWRRCREAAVSAGDILRQGAQPTLASAAKEQGPKQPRARPDKEAGPRVTAEEHPGSAVRHNGDHATLPTKKKKKKKKNRKESEPCPRQKGHVPRAATE